jgi:uncharacterized protein (DUF3084 family)
MSYIKKNVNFGLLFIIIILAVAIASIGIYYNQNYTSLSKNYNQQLDNLQKVTQDLLFHKTILNQTTQDLATKEQDETELNKRYTQLRADKEKVDTDNANLREELGKATEDLMAKTNQLISAQSEIAAQKTQVATLTKQVTQNEASIKSLKNRLDEACAGDTSRCN